MSQNFEGGEDKFSESNFILDLPLELSSGMIEEITVGCKLKLFVDEDNKFCAYNGLLPVYCTHFLVKRFKGEIESIAILEAEKRAALCMHHKNIWKLVGYHKSQHFTDLVFPFADGLTWDENLNELKFQDKMKIAIGIAEGVRYLHQECPRGPIVHGQLRLNNIFLRRDLQPLITGFGKAKWLHLKKVSPIPNGRCSIKDHLDHELVKSDVMSFGILLLRLFCRKSVPKDDTALIKWARPLISQRAFHELIDENPEDLDVHEMYRVMCTAFKCTRSMPESRPCMGEAISFLKGEIFCSMQESASPDTSP